MGITPRLSREFAYNAWANRETLRSLLTASEVPPRAAAVMAHIIGAEWLWLRRLGYPVPDLPVWPTLSLAECASQLEALSAAWRSVIAGHATEAQFSRTVAYTNTKGEQWTNTMVDVITHVVLHSSYHRGQVASLLGRAGERAAYSDYIECVRRGHLDEGWPA